jgi:hypothetical protein
MRNTMFPGIRRAGSCTSTKASHCPVRHVESHGEPVSPHDFVRPQCSGAALRLGRLKRVAELDVGDHLSTLIARWVERRAQPGKQVWVASTANAAGSHNGPTA